MGAAVTCCNAATVVRPLAAGCPTPTDAKSRPVPSEQDSQRPVLRGFRVLTTYTLQLDETVLAPNRSMPTATTAQSAPESIAVRPAVACPKPYCRNVAVRPP